MNSLPPVAVSGTFWDVLYVLRLITNWHNPDLVV